MEEWKLEKRKSLAFRKNDYRFRSWRIVIVVEIGVPVAVGSVVVENVKRCQQLHV